MKWQMMITDDLVTEIMKIMGNLLHCVGKKLCDAKQYFKQQ